MCLDDVTSLSWQKENFQSHLGIISAKMFTLKVGMFILYVDRKTSSAGKEGFMAVATELNGIN